MAQVPEAVLSWLYSVLHEYHDPQRAYSDIARTLSAYPHLKPCTRTFTYENGSDALLLTLKGMLPATFRGTVYNYPVKLHIPHAYPHQPPIVFVDPEGDLLVRPGQHVGVDGRIYHPYLRDWASMWDRANVAEFLQYLQNVFTKEPPVRSRAQQQQFQRPRSPVPPPIPSQQMPGTVQRPPHLPPKQPTRPRAGPAEMSAVTTPPPPLPPKPGEESAEAPRNVARDGPPLPPLPHELAQRQDRAPSSGLHNGYQQPQQTAYQNAIPASSRHTNGGPTGPLPVPPMSYTQAQQPHAHRSNHDRSPVSPISPTNVYSELPGLKYTRPPPLLQQQVQQGAAPPQLSQHYHAPQNIFQQQTLQGHPQPPQHSQNRQHRIGQTSQKQPPPDLLSDPFDLALPGPAEVALPAPPIPPNPEKEHLLAAISGTLVQQAQQKVDQNLSAIAPLQAQQHALRAASERLGSEIRQLEQLEQALASNEAILHRSIQDCDRTIATTKSKKQPPIDEVLIAPTMVANQLWTLCAEEAACREAMYVLQRAVDRGRVSGNDFVRQMRALGRESFMKMALARKCAQGMGLETGK